MRHRKKGNHLGRTASHKKALMRNLAAQVFENKEIRTTVAKAKELRGYVERLITYGKKGTLHHRRLAFRLLQNKQAVHTLFNEIAPIYEDRAGGYTRIIRLGNRKGDNAELSIFQLVGFEKVQTKKEEKKKKAKEEKQAEEKTETAKETKSAPEEKATEQVETKSSEADEKQQTPSTTEAEKDEAPKGDAKEEKAESDQKDDEAKASEDAPKDTNDQKE